MKLAGTAAHRHAYNESGLFAIPFEELGYVRYYENECPRFDPGIDATQSLLYILDGTDDDGPLPESHDLDLSAGLYGD